jgi:hypothetical protein
MGGLILPQCIVRVAQLLAAAAGRSQQQLPQQQPVELPAFGKDPFQYEEVDRALAVSPQEQQLLQGAGLLLAQHCSSKGTGPGLAAVQESTWALAEAAAAAAPMFHRGEAWNVATSSGLELLHPIGGVALDTATLLDLILGLGLTREQGLEAVDSPCEGARGCPEMAATALLFSPPVKAFLQQLQAAGLALSTVPGALPTAAACNNPRCSSLLGASEQQGVSGKESRCSGCQLAFYCQRSCQKQHWGLHKPVCKAVQAATAAAAAVTTSASSV